MWLRSAPTTVRAILLLCALPSLSGCLLVGAAVYATHDVECEAMRSDHERGVESTAWNQSKCDRVEKERLEEARKIVNESDQKAGPPETTPPESGGTK